MESNEATLKNVNLKKKISCMNVYANWMLKNCRYNQKDFNELWEQQLFLDSCKKDNVKAANDNN